MSRCFNSFQFIYMCTKETSTLNDLHTFLESMAVEKFAFVSAERDTYEEGRDEENGSQGGSNDEYIFESEMENSDSFTDFTACANVSDL